MMETTLFFFHEERRECAWDTPPETTLENPHWPLPLPSSLSLLKNENSSGSGGSKEDDQTTPESPTPIVSQVATLGGATTTTTVEETDAGDSERTEVDAVAPREGAFLVEGNAATNIGQDSDGNSVVVLASPGAADGAASGSAGGEGGGGGSRLGATGDGSRHRSAGGEV